MKIFPKVYRFVFMLEDGRPNTSYIVARTSANAVRKIEQVTTGDKDYNYAQYIYHQESWIGNIMALCLPKYVYRGGTWSGKWERLK